jgi:hypothetical protein
MVTKIVNALKLHHVEPWMDNSIKPGSSFVEELEQKIEHVPSAAVFVGTGGLGKWQKAEVEALYERERRGLCLLIPVLLPGVTPDSLPPFLRRLNAVRIGNVQDEAVIELAAAIREQACKNNL